MITSQSTADGNFALFSDEKPVMTPKKKALEVPTFALAEAVSAEWKDKKKLDARTMPLTSIACTALDVVSEQREAMTEALLAYVETDLLSYRAEEDPLKTLQHNAWSPVIAWVEHRYDVTISVTEGIIPVEQPPHALEALRKVIDAMSDMQLAAFGVLTPLTGSFLLSIAVLEEALTAEEAATLSRIDENYQAEKWGVDEEAAERAEFMRQEIIAAGKFLSLLK